MQQREGYLRLVVELPASLKNEFDAMLVTRKLGLREAVSDALIQWLVAQDELVARAHKPGLSGDR